jgi:hypothetical protein
VVGGACPAPPPTPSTGRATTDSRERRPRRPTPTPAFTTPGVAVPVDRPRVEDPKACRSRAILFGGRGRRTSRW